jgi:hypothetical protein
VDNARTRATVVARGHVGRRELPGGPAGGRSRREFIAKLGIAVEEADESVFWLELLADTGMGPGGDQVMLRREAEELLKILARSYRTARGNSEGGG